MKVAEVGPAHKVGALEPAFAVALAAAWAAQHSCCSAEAASNAGETKENRDLAGFRKQGPDLADKAAAKPEAAVVAEACRAELDHGQR